MPRITAADENGQARKYKLRGPDFRNASQTADEATGIEQSRGVELVLDPAHER